MFGLFIIRLCIKAITPNTIIPPKNDTIINSISSFLNDIYINIKAEIVNTNDGYHELIVLEVN